MVSALEPSTVPSDLRRLVSWQANKVAVLGTRLTLQRSAPTDRGDFAVLATLQEFGDLSQAEVGRRLTLDRNDVNAIATRLESNGLIERRTDPDDRRRKLLTTTPDGRRRLRLLNDRAAEVQQALLAGLTGPEQEQLIDLLDLLLAAHGPVPA